MDNPFAPELLIEARGAVRVITMNRPHARNATDARLHAALVSVWDHLAADTAARAVVLTGAGRAFSAGGDIGHLVDLWDDPARRRAELDEAGRLLTHMVDFPLPVVAAVNGPAVGLGCNLALCCDIVLIAESAYLADPHVSLGLTAADGGAPLWPLLTGMLRAKEYLLTGERLPAARAVEFGLANRVVADADLMDQALTLAVRLAGQPPQAVQSTKRALNMHLTRAIAGVLEYALAQEFDSFDTPEHRALVKGVLERSRAEPAGQAEPGPDEPGQPRR